MLRVFQAGVIIVILKEGGLPQSSCVKIRTVDIIDPNSRDNIHHAMVPPIHSPKLALQLVLKVIRQKSQSQAPT